MLSAVISIMSSREVILASYSGLTQEDYDTLSKIAPVVAYPAVAESIIEPSRWKLTETLWS